MKAMIHVSVFSKHLTIEHVYAHLSVKLNYALINTVKFVEMKGHALALSRSDNSYIDDLFSRTTGPISTKHGTDHPWVKGIQFLSNEGPCIFLRGDNSKN